MFPSWGFGRYLIRKPFRRFSAGCVFVFRTSQRGWGFGCNKIIRFQTGTAALVLQTPAQGHCAPRVDYEEVRLRVANAFKEKNHELGEMIGVIQSLSKDVARATDALRSQCR